MLELKSKVDFFTEKDAVLITPDMARELIAHNKCIKPVRQIEIDKLVREFNNNNFDFNGATIVLNENDELIDGRTRLMAAIEADKSFKAFIVTGVSTEGQYTKDTGRSRNVVQYLGTHGYKYPRALSASAKILHSIMNSPDGKDGLIEKSPVPVTHQDVMDIINEEPKLQECVNRLFPNKHNYFTTEIYHLIVLDYLHRYVADDAKVADEFIEVLSGLRPADMDHPVMQLRLTLMNSIQRTSSKLIGKKQVMYMIRAYNYLRAGKSCKRLKLPTITPTLDLLDDLNKGEN